jgi:NAD(P)-dependent dehydrogenase (short-subunit alcohol dehydrogenase family)
MTTRTAVVAGGSAGVGRAVVDKLIARGYRVAILARGKSRLDEMEARFGDQVFTRTCNMAEDAQVARATDEIVAHWGTPDVWVNSAMLTSLSKFEDVPSDEFEKITGATYMGTVNGTRHALRVMKRGNVVNVGSGLSYRAVPFQAAYCGAKHAINGFTQAVRSELIRDERPIALSLVQLPAINTPQFDWNRNRTGAKPQPAPPIFQPEVAADAVLKAIDEDSREVLVGRSVLQLVFGNMLFPELLDRFLAKNGLEMQQSEAPDNLPRDNIDAPHPDYPSRSHGSYDHKAEESGIAVDGDTARNMVLIGGAALLVSLGTFIGRAAAPARPAIDDGDDDGSLPWGYDQAPEYHRPIEYRR